MIEIEIDSDSKKSEASLDAVRLEECWSSSNENFINDIKNECNHKFNIHECKANKFKTKCIMISIPTIILPLIIANLSIFLIEYDYAIPVLMTFIGVLNGLSLLFNFSKKQIQNDYHSCKYNQLADEISGILIRRKRFRQPFDVTLQEITSKKSFLDSTAPN
jgi:hypothetical protein